jgi:hypothetical protein
MNTMFSVGNVLSTGFRIWTKNVVPFLLLTALIYSPVLFWGISSVQGEMDVEKFLSVAKALQWISGLSFLLNILVSAALTYGVVMELQGQRASIGACISTGLMRFFPALGVALLSSLCVAAGSLLLIIPGVIVYCMLYVSTQASVLERPGLGGALRRSRELTQGHKLAIFGLLFVLGLFGFALRLICELVALPTTIDDQTIDEALRGMPLYIYLTLAQQMVVASIGAVMASVTYYFLRAEKEGTSADELAAVFG